MKTYRILSIILIALILGEFVLMLIALFKSDFTQFFIDGGVLVAMILAGMMLKRAYTHKKESEDRSEDGSLKPEE